MLVAIFAIVTLNLGMEAMFSSQVKGALGGAENVARQYMMSEGRGITLDAAQILTTLEQDPAAVRPGQTGPS